MEESCYHMAPSATQNTGRNHNHHYMHLPHLGKMQNSLHLHLPNIQLHSHTRKEGGHKTQRDVPRGCVAVYVGKEGEEQQRFVIPVEHINHTLFEKLLKEAENEYGFEQKGTITIPCSVLDFQRVQELIERDKSFSYK